ncbi:MAG TPA: polysaccharide biosynthesis/export family protein [Stellaceae bacterium]|nr:polysaccharide biosynthesis/export family protein [Stellaceae bacterium]
MRGRLKTGLLLLALLPSAGPLGALSPAVAQKPSALAVPTAGPLSTGTGPDAGGGGFQMPAVPVPIAHFQSPAGRNEGGAPQPAAAAAVAAPTPGAVSGTLPNPLSSQNAPPTGGAPPLPGTPNPQAPPPVSAALPYGAQLFVNPPILFGPIALNRDYIVAPGDQIVVHIWGAYAYNGVQGVDPAGDIFIPQVGPIRVAGVNNGALQSVVEHAVKEVFTQNVNVYSSLLSKQPVAVYVTGAVKNPGRYSGDRLDSPLQYIAQAGGIEQQSGSYRDIRVIRDGKTLGQIDLYAFLRGVPLPKIEFEVNDTIAVGYQRPTVTALGDVQNSYRFELDRGGFTGAQLVALARPNPNVSDVSIQGIRNGAPYDAYVPLAQFEEMRLAKGDTYNFASDYVSQMIFVNVTGQSAGPSSLVVPRGATLEDVLKLIEVDPKVADLQAIYLRRQSVAVTEQQALQESLAALRRALLTARSVSTSDATIHTEEAAMVDAFMQRVQQFTPQGRIVLAGSPAARNLIFEPNDEIVIPAKSAVVSINGEVRIPQTVIWSPGRTVEQYVALAGGYTERADSSDTLLIHASGAVAKAGAAEPISPGDQIMVMPEAGAHAFAIFQDIFSIIRAIESQVAIASGVTLRVTQ